MSSGDVSQPIANRVLSIVHRLIVPEKRRTGHESIAQCVCFHKSGSPPRVPGRSSGTGKSLETEAGHQELPQSDARERYIV